MSDTEASRPIGPILDELGIVIPLADNERVTDAVVIARCVDLSDGSVRLGVFESEVDWITSVGLIEAARDYLRYLRHGGGHDDD